MGKDKQFVALVHESCPICGKDVNESILIHKRMGDLSEVHGKSTGYGDPCEECQKIFDMGAVAMIIADRDKSGSTLGEIYRCGTILGVSEDFIRRISPPDQVAEILEKRFCILDYRDAKNFGLEVNYPHAQA